MIGDLSRRRKLALVLVILLALTAARFWHGKVSPGASRAGGRNFGPPGALGVNDPFPEPDTAMRKRMEAALRNVPADQRKTIEDRMKADRVFFESLRDLPEDQRRKKLQEHFAQNPPPPGLGPNGPGSGAPGDMDNGEPIRLPAPDIRRSMDQQIANSQGEPGG
jgi:hypothetical protein